MRKFVLFLIVALFAFQVNSQTIDIGLYATSCSDFEVRLRALTDITDVTLTNVQFTLKWSDTYGVDLENFTTSYPLAQQGNTIVDGGFNYAVFVGIDMALNNWVAGTEYTVLNFSHDQEGTGTGDFVIAEDAWATSNNADYYAELLGLDKTGIVYENALGVDLGFCPLYITGTFETNDKVYDGNTDATFLADNLTLDDVKPGDDVTLDVVEIDFYNEHAEVDKLVSITLATITGADIAKYELFITPAPTALADITPQPLTAVVVGDPTKPYDGNTDATLAPANYDISGLIGSESMTITETAGTYASPNVGTHTVTVNLDAGDFTAGAGTLLSNYTLPIIAQGDGTIEAIPLSITANDDTKVYDNIAYTGGNGVIYSGFVNGETEIVLGGTLTYGGTSQGATLVGIYDITPGGLTSSNYTITFEDGELEITAVTLGLTVLLQGPYNSLSGLMNTDLNPTQLPNGQPFNVAPWNYGGTEILPATLSTEVDWVLVELRSDENTMVGRAAGLVHSDGTVSLSVNDGSFPGVGAGSDYYIVIWHRNHMPVMSATAQTVPLATYDFTVLANLYGTNPAWDLGSGLYAMIAGDVSKNGILKYSGPGNDRGPIIARIVTETGLNNTNGFTPPGYWQEDVSMNSIVLYLGTGNDRGFIVDNLGTLTGTAYLNNTYTSVVPGAYTGSKDGSNEGPVDIQFAETAEYFAIEIIMNETVTNGVVDNIQFTLAWKAGDYEIDEMLGNFTSILNLIPQGDAVEVDGINYLTYVSVTPYYLPQALNSGESITVLNLEKEYGQLIANRIWIADNDFTLDNNGEFFVSNWGSDVTGTIHMSTVGIEAGEEGFVKLFPNPVNSGNLFMEINSTQDEKLITEIFDMRGRLIKKLDHQCRTGTMTITIDVSDFNTGVYLINIMGETVLHKDRFIVK